MEVPEHATAQRIGSYQSPELRLGLQMASAARYFSIAPGCGRVTVRAYRTRLFCLVDERLDD